jgi:hypothetical protein
MVAPPVRPPAPAVTPLDKPPTAVYVGKIAPTVDNDFILSLLRVYLYLPIISRFYMEEFEFCMLHSDFLSMLALV